MHPIPWLHAAVNSSPTCVPVMEIWEFVEWESGDFCMVCPNLIFVIVMNEDHDS